MSRLLSYACIIFSLSLTGCDSDSDDTTTVTLQGCEIDQQNRYVHDILKQHYLWYQEVEPEIDYFDFNSPQQTLDFLRYQSPGPDRFSYITNESSFQNLFTAGQYVGFGFSYETDTDGRVWLRFVYDDSPAGRAGLQRGDEILSINGQTLTDLTSAPGWNSILGPAEEGYSIDLVVAQSGGNQSIELSKAVIQINTVLHSSILDQGGIKVGYLVFNSFLATSSAELATVFQQFSAAGVSRVILDLRYNGGGSVPVANRLASYLNQVSDDEAVFNRLLFNDRNEQQNTTYNLQPLGHALSPDQLIVITTEQTCSASEMIINGLSPYLTVKTVGSKTCGKPVGMNPYFFCEKALLPVTFENENSDGEGDYFDGLGVDCAATDNVDYRFGDSNEPMLAQALHLAENNSCLSSRYAGNQRQVSQQESSTGLQEIIGAY